MNPAAWDSELFLAINNHVGTGWDYFFGWPTFLGTPVLFSVLFIFIWIWDRANAVRSLTQITAGCAGGVLLAVILKNLIQRPRPSFYYHEAVERGGVVVHMMFDFFSSNSFPSGHTAFVFAAATGLCFIYGRKVLWVYLTVVWVGISRVYVGAHFPLDVAGGAVLGTVGAFLTLSAMRYPQRIQKKRAA